MRIKQSDYVDAMDEIKESTLDIDQQLSMETRKESLLNRWQWKTAD